MAIGQHTRLDNVDHRMQSSPLGSTHCRTMSRVACKNGSSAAHTVGRRWALYAISTLGEHTQSGDVEHCVRSSLLDITHDRTHRVWHAIMSLEKHILSYTIGGGMPSSPLDNIQCPTTSGVDAIMAIVQHIQLNNVGGSMLSSPLDNIHYRTVTGMACHH